MKIKNYEITETTYDNPYDYEHAQKEFLEAVKNHKIALAGYLVELTLDDGKEFHVVYQEEDQEFEINTLNHGVFSIYEEDYSKGCFKDLYQHLGVIQEEELYKKLPGLLKIKKEVEKTFKKTFSSFVKGR
jgi:hypothetical protein